MARGTEIQAPRLTCAHPQNELLRSEAIFRDGANDPPVARAPADGCDRMTSIVAHALVALIGSILAALLYEAVAGDKSFTLPLASILMVTALGTVSAIWWGWPATFSVLGVYTVYNVAAARSDRRAFEAAPSSPAPRLLGGAAERTADPDDITDIIFRTARSLADVAEALGMHNTSADREGYWEWVIGWLDSAQIDITRPHGQPPNEVDTRLFLVTRGVIGTGLRAQVVDRLRPLVSGTISCGRSIHRRGNDFDFVTVEEFS